MSCLYLNVEAQASSDIKDVCRDMAETARRLGIALVMNFNTVPIFASPNSDPEKLSDRWKQTMHARSTYFSNQQRAKNAQNALSEALDRQAKELELMQDLLKSAKEEEPPGQKRIRNLQNALAEALDMITGELESNAARIDYLQDVLEHENAEYLR